MNSTISNFVLNNTTSIFRNVTKVENVSNVTHNVVHHVVSNVSKNVSHIVTPVTHAVQNNGVSLSAYHMYFQLTWVLGFSLLVLLFLLFRIYKNTKGRLKKLQKQDYGWVHFFLKSGKLKTYMMKLQDRFTLADLGTYFCDSSADIIEYKTGIRHRFFFEGSPFQIKFIPTGVNFTVPDDLDPSLKVVFESKAPKVIQLRSNLTSELFDKYLKLAARYGEKIRNVGKFKLDKQTAIAIILLGIGAVIVIKMLFAK